MSDPIKPDFHAFRHEIRDGNAARGFHEDGDSFREFAKTDHPLAQKALANYYTNRITLVIGEGIEAHEELRGGHSIGEVYESYKPVPPSLAVEFNSGAEATEHWQSKNKGKPEGAVVELADAYIRILDIAAELEKNGIIEDFDAIVEAKLEYNGTRGFMHGGRAF